MRRVLFFALIGFLAFVGAAPGPKPTGSPQSTATLPGFGTTTIPYGRLEQLATAQRGLFTIWRYNNAVFFELRKDQFDKDYVELGVPVNGIGAVIFSGITDLQPVRVIRFERQDNKVAILFPSTRFLAHPGTPEQNAVDVASAPTVVGVANIVSNDPKTGNVVFDVSSLLQDVTDIADALDFVNNARHNPMAAYHLDPSRSYFGVTKAFPENVIVNVNQTFETMEPNADVLSVTPDARSLQMTVQYNIAAIPQDDSYMPRLYDDRVGYFVNAHRDFSSDDSYQDGRYYIIRWNMAKGPVVYYLSNTIPLRYREPIRKALLTWNDAFARIGIPHAVEVKDQPSDPSFDPDDIRYNVVRWVTEMEGGFAEAQLLYNPYTGEMIKSGIIIDSDLMRYGKFQYPVIVQPEERGAGPNFRRGVLDGTAFANEERENYAYGRIALALQGTGSYPMSASFTDDYLESIVLHESGHDFGLRHNFIGSEAYTAKELRSAAFTSRYGVASSVMEYSPVNVWSKGTSHGAYFQTVLGPYDYHVIHWGYAPISNAHTPDEELPTLRRWAEEWEQPNYSYLSDEDVDWESGAAIDPRNQQWDLTNDNISWCDAQMRMSHDLLVRVDRRFPQLQLPYDDLRFAFGTIVRHYGRCALIVSRYLGGEYVSRTLRGDPKHELPLTNIPIGTQRRAFAVLRRNVFDENAWRFSPVLLRSLVTQYRYDDWLGNLPPRHDVDVARLVAIYQSIMLERLFTPVTLQRLDDMDLKYRHGTTMDLQDLFTWMQSAVYADVAPHRAVPLVRRNLQRYYTALLSRLANAPEREAPPDAQALARYELEELRRRIHRTLKTGTGDLLTTAHLEAMSEDVDRALTAHDVITIPN
jgi:hypothetical protein